MQINMIDSNETGPMIDIRDPDHLVEIDSSKDGRTLWVNVDGVCRLRISNMSVPFVDLIHRVGE